MADATINGLVALDALDHTADFVPVWDNSASTAKKATQTQMLVLGTPADDSYCGITKVCTAGENLALWNPVYMAANGKVYKARGNATTTTPALGIATAAALADAVVVILIYGKARDDGTFNWTMGPGDAGRVFVDPDTAGALIQGDPTTVFEVGEVMAYVGEAETADILFVNPTKLTVTRGDTPVTSGGALGTPSSGTLTNCSGLPLSGVVDSTSEALGVGTLELGHASDTTISRTGAGAIAVEGVAVLLSGGALGTPASGTLTNCSGLPLSGVTDSTSEALGVGTLELGHASDTTLARVSAGVVSIEGVTVPTISSTNTLTNKRVNPRVSSPSSGATFTPASDDGDICSMACTEDAGTLTIAAPSGTPVDGQSLILRIECTNLQTASWNAAYRAAATTPGALPTTGAFAAGKIYYYAFRYHSGDSKWDYVGNSGAFTAA